LLGVLRLVWFESFTKTEDTRVVVVVVVVAVVRVAVVVGSKSSGRILDVMLER
jgi:hypothetical protein